jgi:hypothetical protein
MMQLTAEQHLSAVLTAKETLDGRGGYKVLHSGTTLTPDEVGVIEGRVKYGVAQQGTPRWQFHMLTSLKVVLSRIVPIPEPDEFGRGRFLAHSLVFNPSDGERLEKTLFDLMRPQWFFSSIDQVLNFEALKLDKIKKVSLDAGTSWLDEAASLLRLWSGPDLHRVARLACDPQSVTGNGQYVQLIGDEKQILDALKVAFLLAPEGQRRFCSFDTNASDFESAKPAFWALGFSPTRGARRVFIDGAGRTVGLPTYVQVATSPLGRWIEAEAASSGNEQLANNLAYGKNLTELFQWRRGSSTLFTNRRNDLEARFVNANREFASQRVAAILPTRFSEPLRHAIARYFSERPVELVDWMIESQQRGVFVRDLVYQVLLQEPDLRLSKEDAEDLKSLAKSHLRLGLLLSLKSNDEARRLQVLADMGRDEFLRCARDPSIGEYLKPWQLFVPAHSGSWVLLFRGPQMIDELAKGISCISEYGRNQARDEVRQICEYLSREELGQLRETLKSSRRLSSLQTALDKLLG